MVNRIFVERKPAYANEARALCAEIRDFLGIAEIENVRIINRYDIEGVPADVLEKCIATVFSEPQVDDVLESLPQTDGAVFAAEYLPGQFDQRADSASQCVQFVSGGARPLVRSAKVYLLEGGLSAAQVEAVKKHVINPVDSREASFAKPDTLAAETAAPADVAQIEGFITMDDDALVSLVDSLGLAMDADDLRFCRDYFRQERRDPTMTELRMIDTYWSDHCRHTTFSTVIDEVTAENDAVARAYDRYLKVRAELGRTKPVTLMDIATLAAKYLKRQGILKNLDESDEINACTVKIDVEIDGRTEPWLLLFKNETHNHPTEIEPFGGAATCIGGAIRDPLSGRAYVYQAMRITGSGDPLLPLSETMRGKLPQRKIAVSAAEGYASYGNQIGLATGVVDELYHDGYVAKHMELGAVVGAAPAANVVRLTPAPGDVVVLIGGRTGRDGCGGATGSSKSHSVSSIEECGAEVQKGNAPEERKLQRLFRDPRSAKLIKKCNDFGAGGVSVAIGELADGLRIDLDAVPKKYDGLDGTELAISESQERMAVVLAPSDVQEFLALAQGENLEATVVAEVTAEKRLRMLWRGRTICDISREFLNSNGAPKHTAVYVGGGQAAPAPLSGGFSDRLCAALADKNICSKRGLSERFDSTIGAGTVLMPFGGKYQRTPAQAMAAKIPVLSGDTDDCSVFAYGCNPALAERNPYAGAYTAVVDSLARLVASGASAADAYLTFQEFFEKPKKEPARWGRPFAALLGAFAAQLDFGVGAIGGKDSMSGSFEQLDVPPTFVSFAVAMTKAAKVISPEFKRAGSLVCLLRPEYTADGVPEAASQKRVFSAVEAGVADGSILSAYALTHHAAEAAAKMCFGNGVGLTLDGVSEPDMLFAPMHGAFLLECTAVPDGALCLGHTTDDPAVVCGGDRVPLDKLYDAFAGTLESVYPTRAPQSASAAPRTYSYANGSRKAPAVVGGRVKVLIPVFPGTNCEYDTARAFEKAGADAEIFVVNNLSRESLAQSVKAFAERGRDSRIIMLPGGFSGGDEPDGSGKFITSFFRNDYVSEMVAELLEKRDGLMCGICNGFQALIKLGLVPFGKIVAPSAENPTLTFNEIGRHQSRLVRTRISSNLSPWLSLYEVGEVVTVPISHGEGRFVCGETRLAALAANGQIATQYVNLDGRVTMDIDYNPNGSVDAIEGITSPDGRVFGKMGHSERTGSNLYKNVPSAYDLRIFQGAVRYFSL